jgi:hypothetical protein
MSLKKESFTVALSLFVSLSHFSFVSTCVHPGERLVSSMSKNGCVDVPKVSFLAARRAWPGRGHDDQLPAPVRRVYDSWMTVSEGDRLAALDAAVLEGFARRPGRNSPRAQCQDLTLSGFLLPTAHSDVRLLTAEQIVAMGDPRSDPLAAVRNSATWVEGELPPRRGRKVDRAVTPGRRGRTRGEGRGAFAFRPSSRWQTA